MQCGVHPYYGYSYYGYTYLLAALKTEVVSACGGLRSVSSMAVMPRLHKSTLTGAGGGGIVRPGRVVSVASSHGRVVGAAVGRAHGRSNDSRSNYSRVTAGVVAWRGEERPHLEVIVAAVEVRDRGERLRCHPVRCAW